MRHTVTKLRLSAVISLVGYYCRPLAGIRISLLWLTIRFNAELGKGITLQRDIRSLLFPTRGPADAEKRLPGSPVPAVDNVRRPLQRFYQEAVERDVVSFKKNLLDKFPANWVAVSISIDTEHGDLWLSRLQAGRTPVVNRLPMRRMAEREGEGEGLTFNDVIGELDEILMQNNQTARDARNIESREDKIEWWSRRKELDKQLQNLLLRIERDWLGGFRGMLSPRKITDLHALCKYKRQLEKIIIRAMKVDVKALPDDEPVFQLDIAVAQVFAQIGLDASDEIIEDAVDYLFDIFHFAGYDVQFDEMDYLPVSGDGYLFCDVIRF